MIMKKLTTLLLPIFILLVVTGCPKKDDDPEPEAREAEYYIHTNPTDGAILSITEPDGSELTYYGTKDEEGYALSLEALALKYPGESDPYILTLDDESAPERIHAPNGTTFEFDIITENSFRLKAISPDGDIQITVPINLDSLKYSSGYQEAVNRSKVAGKRNGNGQIQAEPMDRASYSQVQGSRDLNSLVTLNVLKCGEPIENAAITMITTPRIGNTNYVGKHIGLGAYEFGVPDVQAEPPSGYEEKCDKIGQIADNVCGKLFWIGFAQAIAGNNTICTILSSEIQKAFPGANNKNKIIDVCSKAMDLIPKLCKLHKDKGLQNVCKLAFLLYVEPELQQYQCQFNVQIPGESSFTTEAISFNPNEPVFWEVSVPAEISVEKLITIPGDPAPHQGYEARAFVVCPDPQGTNVIMSIVGDDGYTNTETTTITENSVVSLWVPGADEAVRDIVTCTIGGRQWSVSIVF
jgi:hypothetical protein